MNYYNNLSGNNYMKYFLLLVISCVYSTTLLANDNPVKLCTDMLMQRQEQEATPHKFTNRQAKNYCQCIVPQLEKLNPNAMPSQTELNNLYKQCMDKAGIKTIK